MLPDNASILEQYESIRQRHNVPTQLAVDALHRLYSVDLAPIVALRSLGLQLTNALHPIKVIRLLNNKKQTVLARIFHLSFPREISFITSAPETKLGSG